MLIGQFVIDLSGPAVAIEIIGTGEVEQACDSWDHIPGVRGRK
jgi:hypothetical protein